MALNRTRLIDCCIIRPPKAEAKKLLKPDDQVSFVPMNKLGIDRKDLELKETKKLSEVSGSYTYFAENDVLLAKITPCFENGKLGIARGLNNGIGFGSSEFIVFRSKGDIVSEYLYYYLLQPSFRELGQSVMTGAVGHKRVPKEFIENTEIPLPSIPEQKRIVAILDEAFAGISQAVTNAEKNLDNARELFESYLQQVCTRHDEDWKRCFIGDVCNLFQGLAINKKTKHLLVDKSSLPLLRIKDLRNGSHEQYVVEEGFPEKSRVNKKDIIYTRTGQIGLVFRGRMGVLHNNSFKVVPNKEISKNYLFWWLQHNQFKNIVIGLASRAAQPDITHALFKKQKIIVPSLEYQTRSTELIENLFTKTQQLEKIYIDKLNQLDKLKKSILQKAFTGELH